MDFKKNKNKIIAGAMLTLLVGAPTVSAIASQTNNSHVETKKKTNEIKINKTKEKPRVTKNKENLDNYKKEDVIKKIKDLQLSDEDKNTFIKQIEFAKTNEAIGKIYDEALAKEAELKEENKTNDDSKKQNEANKAKEDKIKHYSDLVTKAENEKTVDSFNNAVTEISNSDLADSDKENLYNRLRAIENQINTTTTTVVQNEVAPAPTTNNVENNTSSGNITPSNVVLANGNTPGDVGTYAAKKMSEATGVPQSTWEYIIARESGGNPNAYNPSGASGLFQTMPFWGDTSTVEAQIQTALRAFNEAKAAYGNGLQPWAM